MHSWLVSQPVSFLPGVRRLVDRLNKCVKKLGTYYVEKYVIGTKAVRSRIASGKIAFRIVHPLLTATRNINQQKVRVVLYA